MLRETAAVKTLRWAAQCGHVNQISLEMRGEYLAFVAYQKRRSTGGRAKPPVNQSFVRVIRKSDECFFEPHYVTYKQQFYECLGTYEFSS